MKMASQDSAEQLPLAKSAKEEQATKARTRSRRPYQMCGNTLKQKKRDELQRWREAIICHLSGEFATQLLYTELKRGQRALVLKAFNEAIHRINHMAPDAFDFDEANS